MSIFCRSQRVEWLVGGLTTGVLEAWARGQSQVNGGVSNWTKWNFAASLSDVIMTVPRVLQLWLTLNQTLWVWSGLCRILGSCLHCLKLTFELQNRWSWGPWNISGSPWARSCRGRWSCARQSSRPWPMRTQYWGHATCVDQSEASIHLTPHLMSTTWYSRPCFSRQYSLIFG